MHEKRHQWDNKHPQKSHGNYNKHKEEEQARQDAKKFSPVRLQISPQNSILIFKGYTGNVNVVPYSFIRRLGIPLLMLPRQSLDSRIEITLTI